MEQKQEPGNHYYIVTVIQVPIEFRKQDPAIFLKDYLDAYYRVAGENCGLDRDIFTRFLFQGIRLLLPEFDQNLLTYRNTDFKMDLTSKVPVLSFIPLGKNISKTSQMLAPAFCEEFVKLTGVFGSGIIAETV